MTMSHLSSLFISAAVLGAPGVRPPAASVTLTIPSAPVPVLAAGHVALVYELHVANMGARPLRIERVEVKDADHPDAAALVAYSRKDVEANVKLIAPRGAMSLTFASTSLRE